MCNVEDLKSLGRGRGLAESRQDLDVVRKGFVKVSLIRKSIHF
jgi:hypothetical protein